MLDDIQSKLNVREVANREKIQQLYDVREELIDTQTNKKSKTHVKVKTNNNIKK